MTDDITARPAVILLVEDDKGDQEITRRALERAKIRNELYIVEDGEEALNYLCRKGGYEDPLTSPRPDLVLLDLNMPKLDGREVLKRIRKHPELKRIVVVVMTTSKQEEDIVRSYELGVNSYITKPMDFQQFATVVQHVSHYWFQIVVLPPAGDLMMDEPIRILAVEDDIGDAEILRRYLRKRPEYRLEFAETLADGLELLA